MKYLIFPLLLMLAMVSCGKDDSSDIPVDSEGIDRTVIIYAVNRSSLASDFASDRQEMSEALSKIDLSRFQVLLYCTDSSTVCSLYRGVKNRKTGECAFEKIKEYERDCTSTSPARVKTVITDALSLYPDSAYDLIFWGHGMSWYPFFSSFDVVDNGKLYSYGGEFTGGKNPNGTSETSWIEINDLAAALPDNRFDTIWFDCCYMAGIEVLYEFRDKCDIFVAYPTEVYANGMPYDIVLPSLLSDRHDVLGAAQDFYDSYSVTGDPATISVSDMSKLESVADAASKILILGDGRPSARSLLNYSRSTDAPFYDLRQFLSETVDSNLADESQADALKKELADAMDAMVIFHAESSKNFNHREWDTSKISGISTHFFKFGNTQRDDFYRSLAWFNRVY